MDTNQIINQMQTKLKAAVGHFQEELKKVRTGRAHPSMLDGVMVNAYGQPMPLRAIGSIIAPEPQLLQITPFDIDNLQAIANGIRDDQSLGLTPTDDGRVVRIQLPPMTAETRQQIVKSLHQKLEEALIAARNIRHEAIHLAEQAQKGNQFNNDEFQRFKKQTDDLIAKQKTELEILSQSKERDIMTV